MPSDLAFLSHTDSVLCCNIDPSGQYAVTGGIDDNGYVWDLATRQVRFECSDHKESVVACGFSCKSTYVATADMNGYLQVRNTTTGVQIFQFDIDEINWILWHNQSDNILLAGTIKGDFWMWNIVDPSAIKTYESFGAATTAARLLSDGLRIVTAYDNGSIRITDLKTRQLLHHLEGNGDEVTTIDINPTNTLVAAGCTNSTTKLISISSGRLVAVLQCAAQKSDITSGPSQLGIGGDQSELDDDEIEQDVNPEEVVEVIEAQDEELEEEDDCSDDDDDISSDSVESVSFSRCGNFLATANLSGCIYIWDVPSQVIRHQLNTYVGITRSFWDDQNRYICACLDGGLRIFSHNLERLNEIHEHESAILDFQSKCGTLVSVSEDKTCRVYRLSEI